MCKSVLRGLILGCGNSKPCPRATAVCVCECEWTGPSLGSPPSALGSLCNYEMIWALHTKHGHTASGSEHNNLSNKARKPLPLSWRKSANVTGGGKIISSSKIIVKRRSLAPLGFKMGAFAVYSGVAEGRRTAQHAFSLISHPYPLLWLGALRRKLDWELSPEPHCL